jgi:peptidylprolyl isomerase
LSGAISALSHSFEVLSVRSRLVLALAAGVAAASLVGCGAQSPDPAPEETTAAAECTANGEASDSVEVTGELGAKPEVTIDAPLEFSETQRTVVIEGDGVQAAAGDAMTVELTMFNAATGDELISTQHDGTQSAQVALEEGLLPGFEKALNCLTVGSRVVAAITPEDAYGETGFPAQNIAPDTALVLVADFVSIPEPPRARADGEPQELPADFPAIEFELTPEGAPTLTLPDEEPPAELTIGVLKKGDGDEVRPGANVTVNYQGMVWDTKTVFDDSWANGQPGMFNTAGVVPGFRKMLEGQTVGSQVIAILPPDEGYGEAGNPQAGIEGNDTLVFIVDILAAN